MLVGRDSEMTQLGKALSESKHALVIISSKPRMGRSALLQELRSRAENLNWRVLPLVSRERESPGTIEIDRNTTEKVFLEKVSFTPTIHIEADDLRIQTTSPRPGSAVPEGQKDETGKKGVSVVSVQSAELVFQPQGIQQGVIQTRTDLITSSGKPRPTTKAEQMLGGTLILIDSYQPDNQFETWFLGQYIPETRRKIPPIVIVVAGYSGDLAALSESADWKIELGPLPVQSTREYFRDLNHHIEAKMEEDEIQAYASASAEDPSLIDALTRLLQLK